jgi:uncharacterized SAM-dependent methyltransferase
MSKTTRLPQTPKKERHASRYAQGGLNISEDVVTATAKALNRPKTKFKVAATGDKYNTYKTRIT